MPLRAKFTTTITEVDFDLAYFGYDESKSWNDLTESEQHEIEDSLRSDVIILVSVKESL